MSAGAGESWTGAGGGAGDYAALGARPPGPQDPATVGRYRIHALLGIGGPGRVYLTAGARGFCRIVDER
jgi:hypothetical protein